MKGMAKDSTMTSQRPAYDKTQVSLALEASIHVGLAILLAIACLLILLPFIPLITWGIIIAVAAYPTFQKLQDAVGGRKAPAAVIFDLLLLAAVIVPAVLLARSFIDGVQIVTSSVKSGTGLLPPPPPSVAEWP